MLRFMHDPASRGRWPRPSLRGACSRPSAGCRARANPVPPR